MTITLSDRVNNVKPSPTLSITATANRLRSEGKDIIGLGVGEPDFDTPDHIKQAGIDAIHNGQTKYTAVDGTAELKDAIIAKYKRDNNHDFQADQIIVSTGGKQTLYNLCQAFLNPGDEVIIPAPYWVSYPDMVILAGGIPVIVAADQSQSYKITAAQLEAAITDKTRLLFINSPSNPSGIIYTRDELRALGEVLLKHPNIIVGTDDMYEHILFGDNKFVNILMATPELYKQCVVFNGVSKAYSMTGWRIGYAGGPAELIKAMKKIQGQSTSSPCSIAQAAAVAALNGGQGCVQTMVKAFEERHSFVHAKLNAIPGVKCLPSDGTFYSFPDVSEAIANTKGITNDLELTDLLLNRGVAVIPGTAFGTSNHIRLSYATSMENLEKALDRIANTLG